MNFKYKLAIVMRKDLNMSTAKFGVQVGHAVAGCIKTVRDQYIEEYIRELDSYPKFQMFPSALRNIRSDAEKWFDEGQIKVVLQAKNELELQNIVGQCIIKEVPYYEVRDFGLTELEPNTFTCVGIGPSLVQDVNKITGNLKLYRSGVKG